MSNVVLTAHAYAALGWHFLPIVRGKKVPATSNGVFGASTKFADAWFRGRGDMNIAIRTGSVSGIFVLDIDGRNGGFSTLSALELEHGPLPLTPHARSGSGNGEHYVFKYPIDVKLKSKLKGGIDILGENRYFVAAPSVHPNGGIYEWVVSPWSTSPAESPTWLTRLIADKSSVAYIESHQGRDAGPDVIERARLYLEQVDPAVSGKGGRDKTFIVAMKLVRGFGLSEAEALPLFRTWNKRCTPPWSDKELLTKLRDASRNGRMIHGCLR